MGLDFSHGNAHWSYSGFMAFRERLMQRTFNTPLDNYMDGFSGDHPWTEMHQAHPLYPLLEHSDCDGELSPNECIDVARALIMAVRRWSDDINTDEGYDRHQALKLAAGMLMAAAENKPLEFR